MADKNIRQTVKNVLVEQLGVDDKEVVPTATFEDLGTDSLDVIELIIAFEEELGIEIPDADAQAIVSVQDAILYLEKRVKP